MQRAAYEEQRRVVGEAQKLIDKTQAELAELKENVVEAGKALLYMKETEYDNVINMLQSRTLAIITDVIDRDLYKSPECLINQNIMKKIKDLYKQDFYNSYANLRGIDSDVEDEGRGTQTLKDAIIDAVISILRRQIFTIKQDTKHNDVIRECAKKMHDIHLGLIKDESKKLPLIASWAKTSNECTSLIFNYAEELFHSIRDIQTDKKLDIKDADNCMDELQLAWYNLKLDRNNKINMLAKDIFNQLKLCIHAAPCASAVLKAMEAEDAKADELRNLPGTVQWNGNTVPNTRGLDMVYCMTMETLLQLVGGQTDVPQAGRSVIARE